MRAKRLAFCRRCSGETAQTFLYIERPGVEMWRCVCGASLMNLGDIPDADGFAIAAAEKWIRTEAIVIGEIDRDEVYAEARCSLWVAWGKYDPTRGLRFRSYASWKVGNLLTDWLRNQRGRTYGDDHRGLKPHANAISYDTPADAPEGSHVGVDRGAHRLDIAFPSGAGDPALDRSPDLARALELGNRGRPREVGGMGGAAYARAS